MMTRGFVTLATGNILYYKMAANMLRSFKLHNQDVPFAIVCDRKNEYTEQFDKAVILEKANGDYRDKFSLLVNSPYDESIFIEPDCLIYKNLDCLWELLSAESDCSSFGWNGGGIDVWFRTEETKKRLAEIVPELSEEAVAPIFNPGYIFIRKGTKCEKMYDDCLKISQRIIEDPILSTYSPLLCNGKLRDDPVFNISMAINGFICHAKPRSAKCIALPSKYVLNQIDILAGRLDVTDKRGEEFKDCALLHFSTRKAVEEGLYLWQVILVNLKYKNNGLYKILNNKAFYGLCSAFRYIKTKINHVIKRFAKGC